MDLDGISTLPQLFVAPLTRNVSEEHLREIFGHFGNVEVVEIKQAQMEGTSTKLYSRIQYVNADSLDAAIVALDKGEIDGVRVRLTKTEPLANDIPDSLMLRP
ncbi:bifunctional RNA-binding domain superfamily/RNA recognition motif domain/Nucleotide-binding alpha-beta plait domain superfamily [Babesia duncani]|uniref:Bifunctional RNA-binding domain superfamily/RNA recognition motif domain/Nucleotide-binding alpha-beta plait domain superfamily n=1 Tax=Babesia duncani TaxID=323732 RepID=A0AAD9PKB6_9APIC|nr:bifunctional RNA-binding domain superfamily/RNA recognition motif domain/Nucleotide-binding alpha-beta plait domain superfamily [Babesia duncani]